MERNERIDRSAQKQPATLNRREFVQKLGAAAGGAGLLTAAFTGCALTPSQKAEASEALVDTMGKVQKVKLSKRMGGIEVGRIVMCQDNSRDLLAPSIASGMNWLHKGGYFRSLPEDLKKLPRESFYVDSTIDNTPDDPDNEERAYQQVTQELDRTGLRYFDVFRAHYGWHSMEKFNKGSNASYRAFTRLKKEGKVRHFGVSQHTGGGYEPYTRMLAEQIDSGLIDSMQLWISYSTSPEDLEIIKRAHKAGIAITAMKTYAQGAGKMQGDKARQDEMKAPGMVGRSCIRYVLNLKDEHGKPYIDMAVSALHNFEQFEENVGAVATKVARADGFHLITA